MSHPLADADAPAARRDLLRRLLRASGLALGLGSATACGESSPGPVHTAPAASGPTAATSAARREALRHRVLAEAAARGGHGPLLQRSVNAQGLARLQAAWQPGDGPICMDLLTDDDPIVRVSCTHLLARLVPDAAAQLQARLDTMPAGPARQRLSLALIDLRSTARPH